MALPAVVTKDYLACARPEIREFWDIVSRRAPEKVQSRVCEFRSSVSAGKCVFRDRDGVVLHETTDAPAPVDAQKDYGPGIHVLTLEKKLADARQVAARNAEQLTDISETVKQLADKVDEFSFSMDDNQIWTIQASLTAIERRLGERVKTLETKATGMQARIDKEARGILFRGIWQQTIDYEQGSICTNGSRAYVAIKAVRPGGAPPSREGGGWAPLFDSADIGGSQLENVADEVLEVIREVVNPLKSKIALLENDIALLQKEATHG